MTSSLLPILPVVDDVLFNFAQSDGFWVNLESAFGTSYDAVKATELRQQWQSRNFGQLPPIEVLSDEVLGTANGAYSSSTNKIYLSASFLNTASSAAIVNVILEEIGHYVDAQINQTDSPGDEGAIFAALVQGEVLSPTVLAELKTEDDQGWLEVNGQNLEVEYNNPTVSLSLTSPSTVTEDGPQNLFYVFSRTGDTTNSLTVNFTVSGNATFNSDYGQRGATSFGTTTGSVTFAAGSSVVILSLDPSSDVVSDGNETVALTLAAGAGYAVGSGSAVAGTILDNDVAPGAVVRGSIATRGHEVGNSYAFAALKSDGSVVTWGNSGSGGDSSSVSSSLTSGVTQIFSNLLAFAALKSDGSVVTWGDSRYGGDSSSVSSRLTSGVTQIFSNQYAFAALKSDGSVVTWGNSDGGGNSSSVSSSLTSGVTQIFSNNGAFAALKSDGSVVTWGSSPYGGNSSSVSSRLTSGVTQIFSNQYAFAALKSDGSVVTWGNSDGGGNSSSVSSSLTSGVTQIFSNNGAFAALKSDGSVVTWGSSPYGGNSSSVSSQLASGVTQIFSNSFAFAALKSDGSVVTWGDSRYGGNSSSVSSRLTSSVTQIFSNSLAFAALKSDGSVVTWGDSRYGGNSSSVSSSLTSGITQIFSTGSAFAALKSDGSVVTWGDSRYGGNSSSVSSQLASGVTQIFSTGRAFAALKSDGSVVTWGDSSYGGNSSSVSSRLTSGVTQIFSTLYAFAALRSDGSVVTWGDSRYGGNSSSVSSQLTSGVVSFADPFNDDRLVPSSTPFIYLAVSPTSVTEDGTSNLIYTFTRTGPTANTLLVNYTIGGTATNGIDYSNIGTSVTFAAGSSTATVTVDPTADTTPEDHETVSLTLAAGTGYNIGTTTAVTGTILDNDTIVTLAVAPASVTEDGTTNLVYTFTRNGFTSNALTVNYTIGGTAINGNDYSSIGSSVTFAAGSSTATVTVDPTADTIGEADETVTLALASGTGYTVGTSGAVTGTITNDDLPTITLAVSSTSVTEDGTSNLIYTFTRTGSTTNTLTVNYTIGGTATNGSDYNNIGTSVTFAAGSSTATVTVDPTADTTPEDHETVSLTLAAGTGYNIGTTTAVTGTILDNDTSVTLAGSPTSVTEDGTTNLVYTLTRIGITSNALTVNYSIGGTAINGNDYSSIGSSVTFAAGSSTATVTVDPTADNTFEANETFILSLASGTGYTVGTTTPVTGTIVNDDANVTLAVSPSTVTEEGTANLVYTFTRTGAIGNALTVNYAVGGTATFNSDYSQTGATAYTTTTGTVTFAAGASTATVTIDPTNDAEVESDESVALTLVSGTGYLSATTNAVTGTILNNDAPTNLILANRNILEDQPVGTVVSELISTDPDTGNTFTYSLVAGTGSTDNNAFTITNNQLKTNAIFDFETKKTYNIRLRTTDQGGLSFDKAFTIGVVSSATPTQIVTTLQDITSSTDGFLSLREAIVQANTANINGTILLGEGRYTLATADDLDIELQGKTLTIQGQGKDLTILDGNSLDRFFEIHSGATVILSGVTVTNGKAAFGGAIANAGTLTIRDSTITNNQSRGIDGVNGAAGSNGLPSGGNPRAGGMGGSGSSGGDAGGGAIYNSGIITMTNTFISNNQAIGGRGGNGGRGGSGSWAGFFGPPFIGGRGGNGGDGGDGGDARGGGIFNAGQATLTNVVVGSHSVTAGTGGSAGSGGSGGRNASGSFAASGNPGTAGIGGVALGEFIYNSGAILSNQTLNGIFNEGGSVEVGNNWAVTLAVSPSSVTEDGVTNLVYTFSRRGGLSTPLTVNYSVGGTATLNTDYTQTGAATYTATAGTVTFAAGSSTATVTIDPTADSTIEANETVVLTLALGTGYDIGTTSAVAGAIADDDSTVTLAVSPGNVQEDGTPNLIYTFTRSGNTSEALTVNYTVGGTATFNTDYSQTGGTSFSATSGTMTFAAGSSTATLTIDPTVDTTVEPDETVALTLTSGSYKIGTTNAVSGTIINDDASVSLAVSPSSLQEDGTQNLIYTFTRTGVTTNSLTVNYTIGGTATLNTDYTRTGTTNTVTFAAGSSTATVTIDPTADTIVEPDETVILTLAAGTGYAVGTTTPVTGTINDDELPSITLAVSPASVTEDGTTNLIYTFTRSGLTTNSLTVNYTLGGTATLNTDYTRTGTNNTVTFAAGSSTATVTIDPTPDTIVESNETVALTLAAGTGYTVGTTTPVTGTITNASATGQYASSVIAFSSQYSSSSWSAEQALGQPNTFSYGDISTSWAPSTRNGDGDAQADEFITLGFSTPVYADGIEIRETWGNGFVRSIDLLDNQGVYHSIWSGVDPSLPGNPVNFRVNFQPTNYLVVGAKINVDIDHDTRTWEEIDSVQLFGVGDVISNITLAVAPASVTEDGTTNLIYTFTRNGVTTNPLTVNYTLGGTATLNTDYTRTGTNNTVTFAAGSSTATVTVDPTADTTVEPDETVILTLASGTGYTVGTTTAVTGTITNVTLPSITLAVSPSSVTEDGTTNLVYTFTRTGVTTNSLTVNYTLGGTATLNTDYTRTGTTNTVTFAANSSTATVTVDPKTDTTVESNETIALTLASGTGYTVGTTTAVTGTITNDDFSKLSINNITVVEGKDNNAILTVTVNNPNPQPISVNYTTAPINATANVDYTSKTGTLTIAANTSTATISIPILNDNLNEANETFAINLSNPVNATLTNNKGIVTISDTLTANVTTTLPANVENLTLTGSANINGTGNAGNNKITGNSGNNQINGRAGIDTLTGGLGADTFIFQFGQSTIAASDSITDFAINSDKIDLLTQGGLATNAPISFSRATDSTTTTLDNLVNQVFTDANGAITGNQGLGVNSAALVQVTTGAIAGTYLVINDSTAGFQSSNDLLINITGFTGNLPALGSINVSSFFI